MLTDTRILFRRVLGRTSPGMRTITLAAALLILNYFSAAAGIVTITSYSVTDGQVDSSIKLYSPWPLEGP